MVKTEKNLTDIKLTESDADGIWLHFDGGGKSCGILLSTILSYKGIANEAIMAWAREQLDSKRYHLVEIQGDEYPWHAVWGDPIKGKKGVGFKKAVLAKEFIEASNNGRKIRTPIPFHEIECCGCTDFYFSPTRQGLIAVCNECGAKRVLPMNEPGIRPSPPVEGGY